VGQRDPVRPIRIGPRPGPLTAVLRAYFRSNLGGTLVSTKDILGWFQHAGLCATHRQTDPSTLI
jgi:hypothetical protein